MFFDPPEKLMDEPREPRRPNALYARIDQIEGNEDEGGTVLFDCIDTNWVDDNEAEPTPISSIVKEEDKIDANLYILALDLKGIRDAFGKFNPSYWYCIKLRDLTHKDQLLAQQFSTLFSDPTERGVVSIKRVDNNLQTKLNYLAGWGDVCPSDEKDIFKAVRLESDIDAIAIYDVGQGAATALLSDGIPQLYFDFGGSVIGNWRSFPKHLTQFCFTSNPTIILSHWDWDHWSSALRDRKALKATWVLPLQAASGPLGAVHARFLALLRQHGKILWWDKNRTMSLAGSRNSSKVYLFKAKGPKADRNQSGIGLILNQRIGSKFVLLPGDASYKYCPRIKDSKNNAYFMVPHHGGKTDLSRLPNRRRNRSDHVIYSYGTGNIFMHPRPDTVKAIRKGFTNNTHTALRNETGFGHVGIDISGKANRNAKLPCRGSCNLQIQQWI